MCSIWRGRSGSLTMTATAPAARTPKNAAAARRLGAAAPRRGRRTRRRRRPAPRRTPARAPRAARSPCSRWRSITAARAPCASAVARSMWPRLPRRRRYAHSPCGRVPALPYSGGVSRIRPVEALRPVAGGEPLRERHALRRADAPPGLAAYFERTLLDQPWADPEIPSLVYEGAGGRIVGFVGSHVRGAALRRAPRPDGVPRPVRQRPRRSQPGGGRLLLRTFLAGGQDVSIAEGTAKVAGMWTRLGGVALHGPSSLEPYSGRPASSVTGCSTARGERSGRHVPARPAGHGRAGEADLQRPSPGAAVRPSGAPYAGRTDRAPAGRRRRRAPGPRLQRGVPGVAVRPAGVREHPRSPSCAASCATTAACSAGTSRTWSRAASGR